MLHQLTLRVLDYTDLLRAFANEDMVSPGSTVKPNFTTLYQSIALLTKEEYIKKCDVNPRSQLYPLYFQCTLNKYSRLPSPALQQYGGRYAYFLPVEIESLKTGGHAISYPDVDTLGRVVKINNARIFHSQNKIVVTCDIRGSVDPDNHVFRSQFYINRVQKAADSLGIHERIPDLVWASNTHLSDRLERAIAGYIYRTLKDLGVTSDQDRLQRVRAHIGRYLTTDQVDLFDSPISDITEDEMARAQKAMEEIMAAEAELRGITVDDLKKTANIHGTTT